MRIELFLNGEFNRAWIMDDIREQPSELGGFRWQKRIDKEIVIIKNGIYWMLEYNDYEFYVVYEADTEGQMINSHDMHIFEDRIKIKHRIAKKLKHAV